MTGWTAPQDVRDRLSSTSRRAAQLTRLAAGEPFRPLDLKITGPKTAELNGRHAELRDWIAGWREQDRRPETDIVYRTAGGHGLVGKQQVPDRLRIGSLTDLDRFLGTTAQTRRYREILALTADHALHDWVSSKPMRALDHYDDFPRLIAALDWIAANAGSGRHLREIDALDVDTKFIERHQRIVLELAGLVVPDDLVDPAQPTVAGRFGFAVPGRRVRMRRLDLDDEATFWPMPGFDDVEVRAEDLARVPLDVDQIYVVENLATYLAFPATPRSVVVFGGGYAAAVLGAVRWLRELDVLYWGDLDTHGLAILDRLRSALPHVESILMDRRTLLAHRAMWGTEPSQVTRELPSLTAEEAACHRELVNGVHGRNVRLEQERIPMAAVSDRLLRRDGGIEPE